MHQISRVDNFVKWNWVCRGETRS